MYGEEKLSVDDSSFQMQGGRNKIIELFKLGGKV